MKTKNQAARFRETTGFRRLKPKDLRPEVWATIEHYFAEAADTVLERLAAIPDHETPPGVTSFLTVIAEADVETDWLISGIWPRDELLMIHGPWHSGKTFLALDIGLTMAAGLASWHGHAIPTGTKVPRVLYVPSEGRRGVGRRVAAWVNWQSQTGELRADHLAEGIPFDRYDRSLNLSSADSYDNLRQTIEAGAYEVVILDVVSDFAPGVDENSRDFGHKLKLLAPDNLGASSLVVHHEGYGENAKGRPRGSSSIPAAIDVGIGIQHATYGAGDEMATRLTVTNTKMRNEDQFPAFIAELRKPNPSLLSPVILRTYPVITGPADAAGVSSEQFDYLKAVAKSEAPLRPGELAKLIGGHDRQERKWRKTMIKAGYMVEVGKGSYMVTPGGREAANG